MKTPLLSGGFLRFLSQRPRESASLAILLSSGLMVCTQAMGQPPVPVIGVKALPKPAADWHQQGQGATYISNDATGRGVVTTKGMANILHWSNMDVGRDASLTFVVDTKTSTVLNKVDYQSDAKLNTPIPTVIDGTVRSIYFDQGVEKVGGNIYIYSPSGIVFGATARVDVNSLLASSLKIDDERFMNGLLSPAVRPIFELDQTLPGMAGSVVVQGRADGSLLEQAALSAQQGGLILLAAPQITNDGVLSAPDGQVILAAGAKVYLADSGSTTLRGLRVEVSTEGLEELAKKVNAINAQYNKTATVKDQRARIDAAATRNASRAVNGVLGNIAVNRGNITMAGLMVNQMGVAQATTSVSLNGSIYLKAEDGASKASGTAPAVVTTSGALVLGDGSQTLILPTLDDTTTTEAPPNGQPFKPSVVTLAGKSITLEGGAEIVAPSGQVTLTARSNPVAQDIIRHDDVKVTLGEGSLIDVSGSTGTELAMENNVVTAELRGNEMADNVLLKDNPDFKGQGVKVSFDRRKVPNGIAVANVKGYLNQAQHNVGEYTAAGGSVAITSEGSIEQRAGSAINVSGGWVKYKDGYLDTSKMTLGGRLYDIETASATLAYDGAVTLGASNANFEAGYVEGASAGTVQFAAPDLSLNGQLQGSVTRGRYQRDLGAASRVLGGQLLIGNVSDATMDGGTGQARFGAQEQFGYTGNVVLGRGVHQANALNLDTDVLSAQGFSRINAITQGDIELQDASLLAGGQLRLGAAGSLSVTGSIQMPGGSVTASALNSLSVAKGVGIDLAGRWQNDLALAQAGGGSTALVGATFLTKGGSLRLSANQLAVGDDVSMDVSGGAWLNTGSKVAAGDAGAIVLQATTLINSLDGQLSLGKDVTLAGYGLSKGGSLTLVGRNVVLGGDQALADATEAAGDLFLSPEFFTTGGFANRTVAANGNLTVTASTPGHVVKIQSEAQTWGLGSNYQFRRSGAMSAVASILEFPDLVASQGGIRQASSLTLRASGRSVPSDGLGILTVGQGAQLLVDPGASITLAADQRIVVDGLLQAHGGSIGLSLLKLQPDPTDESYDNTRSIWLGQHAYLDASGTSERVIVNGQGVASGEVLDGGTVQIGRQDSSGLHSAVGYVVAEQGSVIDVSGTERKNLRFKSGAFVSAPQDVGSGAGTIDIRAREGLMLLGELRGKAGNDRARGGTLSVSMDREGQAGSAKFPQGERELILTASTPGEILPQGLKPGGHFVDKPGRSVEGKGYVPLASFEEGGFSNLKFKSQDAITFAGASHGAGEVSLVATSSIELEAPVFRAQAAGHEVTQATVAAPYVSLGNSDVFYQDIAPAQDGQASLVVTAHALDLVGNSATQGFGSISLQARDDIRLVGTPLEESIGAPGSFNVGHQLTLTATQIYPTTLSTFTLALTGQDALADVVNTTRLSFLSTEGRTGSDVLSAGGSLIAKADFISQGGRVLAPFGSISLQAADTLSYEPLSMTSVAGNTTVPFGTVVNGTDWTYELGGQTIVWRVNPSSDVKLGEKALPTKVIESIAPVVALKDGATLDASGGGALYAYEFTPGPGGTADVLQSSGGAKNQTFAISLNFRSNVSVESPAHPGTTQAPVAPLDVQYGKDGLKVGDQVYLSGGNGLPAGYYTLLPGHYALLPGGYAIEPTGSSRDMSAQGNTVNTDGSMTIAGYRLSSNDGRGDTRTSGFTVSPVALIHKRSEFTDHQASTFFVNQAIKAGVRTPQLPIDAGRVAFSAVSRMVLDGKVLLSGAAASADDVAGQRGTVDITAPFIDVVSSRTTSPGSYVELQVGDLNAMNASSLLIGGTRQESADGVHLNVQADMVRVDNAAAPGTEQVALQGAELILAAKDMVQITGDASLDINRAMDGQSKPLMVDGIGAAADGALVRLGSAQATSVSRINPQSKHGRIDIGLGAKLKAPSTTLDATTSMSFGGQLELQDNASLMVSVSRILLGQAIPANQDGMVLDSVGLAQLGAKVTSLALNSYSTIDTYGDWSLGTSSLKRLTLSASGLVGHASKGIIQAQTVALAGNSPSAGDVPLGASLPTTGQTLAINAGTIEVGSGQLAIRDFASTSLNAGQQILATGRAGVLSANHDLNLNAPQVSTINGGAASFESSGRLNLASVATDAVLSKGGLGGSLKFTGDTVTSSTKVLARAGHLSMAGTHGVTVASGSLNAQGAAVAFGSTQAYAPGGSISLDGGAGPVLVNHDAVLDVSAVAASAGAVNVSATGANGRVVLDGQILAGASSAATGLLDPALSQGRLSMDVRTMQGGAAFTQLNAKLNDAGMTQERQFRVRDGDVTLDQGGLIHAHDVQIAADNGNLTVAGRIDASGPSGGTVKLNASQARSTDQRGKLHLTSTASILANATTAATSAAGALGDGGRVELGVSNAGGEMAAKVDTGPSIVADKGSRINVSGLGEGGQNGTIKLSAPRVGTGPGSDVAITRFASTVIGSRSTSIEGVKTYNHITSITEHADSATNLDAGLHGKMMTDAVAFMKNQQAIANRLNLQGAVVSSGIEVRSDGDLTVSVNEQAFNPGDRGWNLAAMRPGDQAGTLTLRAQGDLLIKGSISDGFIKPDGHVGMPDWALSTSPVSWNIGLVGGSDFTAANALAVAPGAGDVSLRFAKAPTVGDIPVALVRTGTGRIDVVAGRDLSLGTTTLLGADNDHTQDLIFGATIYTAGHASSLLAGFEAPLNQSNALFGSTELSAAQFGTDGGGLSLFAYRDVLGAPVPQLVNTWLFRQGRSGVDSSGQLVFEAVQNGKSTQTLNTAWWARPDYFRQGIATFGGGSIDVQAARGSVKDLSVNVATNAYIPGRSPVGVPIQEQGGGDIAVTAGADILGGSFYAQKGAMTLSAGGSVAQGSLKVKDVLASTEAEVDVFTALRPIFALGDASLSVTAGSNIDYEVIYNPTLTRQSINNVVAPAGNQALANLYFSSTSLASIKDKKAYAQFSGFSTYGAATQAKLVAVSGDVVMENNGNLAAAAGGLDLPLGDTGDGYVPLMVYGPASFKAAALAGNLTSAKGFGVASSAAGQLDLLAAKSLTLHSDGVLYEGVVMLDNDPGSVSSPSAPTVMTPATEVKVLQGQVNGLAAHATVQTANGAKPLHVDATEPVRFIANEGDITGDAAVLASLKVPKLAEIMAGGDIRDLGFAIQHNGLDDVSTVQAGRDFIDTMNVSSISPVKHVVGGPGLLTIAAGRDVDLGNGKGVVTRGNLDNAYLPVGGASVMALAGSALPSLDESGNPFNVLKANADFFNALVMASKYESLAKQEESGKSLNARQELELVKFDEALVKAFPAYFEGTTPKYVSEDLTDAAKVSTILADYDTSFKGAFPSYFGPSSMTNRQVAIRAFDAVLKSSFKSAFTADELPGQILASDDHPYLGAFDRIIGSTFSGATGGNINVFGSQFKTEQGGSIDLMAPAGSVVAGLVSVPSYLLNIPASENGIFTIRGGAIRIFVRDNFLVNQGRVFTLGGGDISMISQHGNIDAGRGAKTASAAPPPLLTTDANGNVKLDISGSISGSGIATLKTSDDQAEADVVAVAPRGNFDAGDGGVRSTGKVDLIAKVVLNAGNIAAAGGSSGVVSVDTGALAGVVAPSNTGSAADEATRQLTVAPKETLALSVEVLGYGEINVGAPGAGPGNE
jgi:filamentous hemagglutinin